MFTSAHFLEKICVNVLKCRVSFLGSVFKTFTLMHSYVSIFDHTKRAAIEHALNVKPGQSLTNPGLWSGSDVWMASPLARFWSKIQEQEQEQDLEQAWSKIEIASTFHTYLSNRLKRSRRLLLKYSLHFSLFLLLFSSFQRNKIMLSETVHSLSDIPLPQRSVLSLLMYVLHTALYFMSSI